MLGQYYRAKGIPRISGVSVARNHAMDKARGTYISFVDADDMVGAQLKKCDQYLPEHHESHVHANMVYRVGQIDDKFPAMPLGDNKYFMRMIKSAQKNDAEIAMGGKIVVKYSTKQITALIYKKTRTFDTGLADKKLCFYSHTIAKARILQCIDAT